MISVPFGIGIVVAFFFFLFELIVFPMLFYSTTILASLFMTRKKKKEEPYFSGPMKFPLWSEGLMRYQMTHICILLIRVLLITVPVYLEYQLESQKNTIYKNLPLAFLPKPISNISLPGILRNPDNYRKFEVDSSIAFYRCSTFDEEGWLVASIAKATLHNGQIGSISCIPKSETRIYKKISISEKISNISFETISCINVFSGTQEDVSIQSTAHLFLTQRGDKNKKNEAECFLPFSFRSENVPLEIHVYGLTCQKSENDYISFFRILKCISVGSSKIDSQAKKYWELLTDCNQKKVSMEAKIECQVHSIAAVKFMNGISITAMHLYVSTHFSSLYRESNLYIAFIRTTAKVLYTRAENYSVELEGDSFDNTAISDRILIIGAVETSVILVFTTVMWYISSCTNLVCYKPNTLNGLSKIWASSEAVEVSNSEGQNFKGILLKMIPDEEKPGHYIWVSAAQMIRQTKQFVKH